MSECNPLLDRIKQVGALVEASCGAGGTFNESDFKLRISSLDPAVSMAPIEDNTLSATLSPKKLAMGEKTVTVKIASKLVGSGVAGTLPEHDVYLRGCGMVSVVLNRIAIGAVTDGPFTPGEVITQAVSLATGRVMQACYNGDSYLYFIVLSGTWNASGEITGGTTGATATPSAAHSAAGFAYHPETSNQETIAIRSEEDGTYTLCYGAMGSFSISSESSGTATIEYTFNGKYPESGSGDAALTTGITRFDTAYPTFVDAQLVLDRGTVDEFTPVVRSISIDTQGTASVRKDANDASGLIAAKITERTPTITVTAETMKAASFDVFQKMADSESVSIGWRWKAPDNKVWVWGTNSQIVDNPKGSADGFSTNDLTFRMNGASTSGDDELWLVFSI
jgi:hypothetical protein